VIHICSKIGDTALQEAINREGYDKLRAYYDKYTAALGNPRECCLLCYVLQTILAC
jgi:hypothetical protein